MLDRRVYSQVFAARLSEHLDRRRAKGDTQASFAERLGLSAQTITNWRSSAATPSVGDAAAMAEMLGTSLDELTGLTPGRTRVGRSPAEQLVADLAATGISEAIVRLDRRRIDTTLNVAAPDLMEVLRRAQQIAKSLPSPE